MQTPLNVPKQTAQVQVRAARGLPDDLVRISAGIEDIDDLLADLSAALDGAAALRGGTPTTTAPPAGASHASGNGAIEGEGTDTEELAERVAQLEGLVGLRNGAAPAGSHRPGGSA